MKKFICSVICVLLAVSAYSQNLVKHCVAKGESLSLIAKRYNVSEETIVEHNPNARQFIYVGMELMIPVVPVAEGENTDAVNAKDIVKSPKNTVPEGARRPPLGKSIQEKSLGMSFLFPLGMENDINAFGLDLFYIDDRYMGHSDFFMEVGLAYTYMRSSVEFMSIKSKSKEHRLGFWWAPVGYDFGFMKIKAGVKESILYAGKVVTKYDNKKETKRYKDSGYDFEDRFGTDWFLGLNMKLGGAFTIGVEYTHSIDLSKIIDVDPIPTSHRIGVTVGYYWR